MMIPPIPRTALGLLMVLVATAPAQLPRVLFLTHSAGFKHEVVDRKEGRSLSHAEEWFTKAARGNFEAVCTQDCRDLDPGNLAGFQAVVFYTTGELPVSDQTKVSLIEWVKTGGGFTGIHCATDTFYEFAPYGEMIGGYFDGHPWHEKVRVNVEDREHPASDHLGGSFDITDEIYQFKEWSRDKVQVLLSLDGSSVDVKKGARPDGDYALAWCRNFGKGRVFYTALGHRPEVWTDPRFLVHLVSGIRWTLDSGLNESRSPAGAVVLFHGQDGSAWKHRDGKPFSWKIQDGAMEVVAGTGDLVTKEMFGDVRLHLEFMTPRMPGAKGQARGNSGVYLQGRHEVQVLDSFGLVPSDGDCGAIYGQKVPDLNACLEPGVWQTYDIKYQAAVWDSSGRKTANARLTVRHNGLLIHDDVEVDSETRAGMEEGPTPGPILLQDHGDVVRYRNIWLLRGLGPQ
jgi:type 1 glutamine amidotransferase